MKLSRIKTAKKNINDGAWVRVVPDLPGVSFKTRGMWNADAARKYAEARVAMSDEEFKDEDVQRELDIRILCEDVLLDWAGIEDENGEPLAFDPESAKNIFADEELVLLYTGARWAAQNVGVLGRETLEDAAKN